ncbi:MAG TPA: PmoA family protein [Agriterribacter sp.]|nr:PmoA family protein [Agriterribacter sp.]
MRIRLFAGGLPLLLCGLLTTNAQTIATLTLTDVQNNIGAPVSVNLDAITTLPSDQLILREIKDKASGDIPFQIENGTHRFLWWMVKKEGTSNKRVYEIVRTNAASSMAVTPLALATDQKRVVITNAGKNVLQYNFGTHYPPAGVDSAFKRSGFIHPLWSPSGNILTRINAPDHYHHMGLWNPWTHVLFEGREIDFWNLGDKKGTVRFDHFISKNSGSIYAGFRALQQHIAFNIPSPGMEKTALDEVWDIKVYNTGAGVYLIDFTSSLNCATDSAVILEEYRYGGFGFRATEDWNNANSTVLTSDGKNRKEADASTARWCMIDGDLQSGHSGIVFMSYPANYNYPEPMRVWPEDANKRGDVFFSFSPTRNKDWPLYPGKNYILKYRMMVFDGKITTQQADEAWQSFANPPEITIKKI